MNFRPGYSMASANVCQNCGMASAICRAGSDMVSVFHYRQRLCVAGAGVKELERLLLLLLGCAVQCDKKEEMIEIIQNLDISVQHAMVSYIQQVSSSRFRERLQSHEQ